MTFHEAIETVIRKYNKPMTGVEIALELNTTQLYFKKDGSDIKSSQVEARANSYPKLFYLLWHSQQYLSVYQILKYDW